MSKCRIALVSFDVNEGRAGLYPPLNLCVLATSLERAGYEVRAFDYAAPFSGIERYYREIRDYGPTMVGMACFTPYVALLHRISAGLRQAVPDAAFVMGGYHPTALPEWPLLRMPQFDYAMQGECDYAIVRLAEMLEGRRRPEAVPGLVYREGNEIRKNQREIVCRSGRSSDRAARISGSLLQPGPLLLLHHLRQARYDADQPGLSVRLQLLLQD